SLALGIDKLSFVQQQQGQAGCRQPTKIYLASQTRLPQIFQSTPSSLHNSFFTWLLTYPHHSRVRCIYGLFFITPNLPCSPSCPHQLQDKIVLSSKTGHKTQRHKARYVKPIHWAHH